MSISLKEIAAVLTRAYYANMEASSPVLFLSKPSAGKTHAIKAWADRMQRKDSRFGVWMFDVASMRPDDIQATMFDQSTNSLRVVSNHLLPNAHNSEQADAYGVVVLDELLNGDNVTMKSLQKYVNGEDLGALRKPQNVLVVAMSNRLEDKAGVVQQFRAFMNRFAKFNIEVPVQDYLDYAAEKGWHPVVQGYLKQHPNHVDNYAEVTSADSKTNRAEELRLGIWANMRGWERVSRLHKVADQWREQDPKIGDRADVTSEEVCGVVGAAVGSNFMTFRLSAADLPSWEDIVHDPKGVDMPARVDHQFVLVASVLSRVDMSTLYEAYVWAQRLVVDLQVYMIKELVGRPNPGIKPGFKSIGGFYKTDIYAAWISQPRVQKAMAEM